jgi:hypothetical protein
MGLLMHGAWVFYGIKEYKNISLLSVPDLMISLV